MWLDAYECIDDQLFETIKLAINQDEVEAFNIEYQHFINDFVHVDNSVALHLGIFRLYRNNGKVDLTKRRNHSLPPITSFKNYADIPNGYIWHL